MSEQTRQSGAGTTTTTVAPGETQGPQSDSQAAEGAETTSEQTLQSGAGTTTTTMTSSESRRGGAPSTTKTTNTKQQQPGKKPEQSIPAGAQESGAVTTTEYHLSTEPEEIVEIGPGGSGSTDTTSQAPAAVKTSTRTSQRIATEAAATEEAEAASWFRPASSPLDAHTLREHADADQPSQWSKERLDVAEGNEIKFGFSRSDQ
ncbi:unnamed protein product [Symbiodinium sp. CCMP2456]|nr:unnamed protein product [Symbiodinium sp. CCMP2456]